MLRRCIGFAVCLVFATPNTAWGQDPFADEVVSFSPGTNAGFGQDQLPDIVLGPPFGGGLSMQSLDVVSLGNDGEITVGFDAPVICDGAGVDFTVFENAFRSAGGTGPVFVEAGIVSVSQDGVEFFTFPYDPETFEGLAGKTPVLSAPDNGIDPTDPAVSGGDSFDLADVGLDWAAYVRITDPGASIADPGNLIPPGILGGFDLDAVAAVHTCPDEMTPTPTPTASALFTPTATPGLSPTPTATFRTPTNPPDATSTSTPTPTADADTPTQTPITSTATASPDTEIPGDTDGNGTVDDDDREQLVRELFDGDGSDVSQVAGGMVASTAGADSNQDGLVTAADLLGVATHASP